MPDLMPYAEKVALSPPLNVWRTHTEGIAAMAELRAALTATLADLEGETPSRLSEMYYGKAGTICDVTAYSMMVIGAGLERVRALRGTISHWGTKHGDRVRRYKNDDGTTVGYDLAAWANKAAPGVLQFKFDATGGMHTFAVERFLTGGQIRFRVYQSYEGLYRFSDFLGLTDGIEFVRTMCREQVLDAGGWREDIYGPFDVEQTRETRKKKQAKLRAEMEVETNSRMAIIGRTRDQIGRGRALTREELFLEVITPLRNMLDTGITGVDYTKLAGHASDGRVFCNTLLVAFCDEIDPSQFEANYQTLVACEGMLGGWLDPSLAG